MQISVFLKAPQIGGETRQAFGGEAPVAVGDDRAYGRWIAAVTVFPARTDTEAAVPVFAGDRTQQAGLFALARMMGHNRAFLVKAAFPFEKAVAAASAVGQLRIAKHQPLAAQCLDLL